MPRFAGKTFGVPVATLLGGIVRERVPYSAYLFYKYEGAGGELGFGTDSRATGWAAARQRAALDPDGIVAQAQAMVKEFGFESMKLKGGFFDKVFVCPADKFSVEWSIADPPHRAGPLHENTLTNFTSYLFNGGNTKTNPPVPGIAGARLGSLQNPAKTVLVAEGSAFGGFSWHKPQKELLFRDSLNEVGYVDGHVDFVKIFWNGSLGVTGAACFYDPPQGYAYTWSGK